MEGPARGKGPAFFSQPIGMGLALGVVAALVAVLAAVLIFAVVLAGARRAPPPAPPAWAAGRIYGASAPPLRAADAAACLAKCDPAAGCVGAGYFPSEAGAGGGGGGAPCYLYGAADALWQGPEVAEGDVFSADLADDLPCNLMADADVPADWSCQSWRAKVLDPVGYLVPGTAPYTGPGVVSLAFTQTPGQCVALCEGNGQCAGVGFFPSAPEEAGADSYTCVLYGALPPLFSVAPPAADGDVVSIGVAASASCASLPGEGWACYGGAPA